ncbi:hypothetical protein [Larsenimonas suaedae]|uniref:Uncharacterized protein n=1 Tax=Larsenimonas suaedae TaxID=1851019 RepID=A0ABU1GSY4_9GAMM|nr:hypothetical protein [Larsenimonas suaedae]MCM2972523.1 hypothetical protein [Larsenimonas suaedae]MDR5894681.1 hypothetical protein [Larsenimonas suaedae]
MAALSLKTLSLKTLSLKTLARKMLAAVVVTAVAALALTLSAPKTPFADQLVRVSVHQALPPDIARALDSESQALNRLFLAYSSDEALTLAARRAMLKHPQIARSVLIEHGLDPDFQHALDRLGADTVVPVHYFETNDLPLVNAQLWAADKAETWSKTLMSWWEDDADTDTLSPNGPESAHESETLSAHTSDKSAPVSLTARATLAIALLNRQGYRFLDQFVVDKNGVAHWLQGERTLSVLSDFFTGGLRGLERKAQSDHAIGGWDIASAGLDVLVIASTVKAVRAGAALRTQRAGQATRATTAVERRALLAGAARGVAGSRTARWLVYGSTAWLVVTHPSLINGLGASVAELLGWPAWLGQGVLWFIVLLPALWLLSLAGRVARYIVMPVPHLARQRG